MQCHLKCRLSRDVTLDPCQSVRPLASTGAPNLGFVHGLGERLVDGRLHFAPQRLRLAWRRACRQGCLLAAGPQRGGRQCSRSGQQQLPPRDLRLLSLCNMLQHVVTLLRGCIPESMLPCKHSSMVYHLCCIWFVETTDKPLMSLQACLTCDWMHPHLQMLWLWWRMLAAAGCAGRAVSMPDR